MNDIWIKGNNIHEIGWYWLVVIYREQPIVIPNPFPYYVPGYEFTHWHEQALENTIAFQKIEQPEYTEIQ